MDQKESENHLSLVFYEKNKEKYAWICKKKKLQAVENKYLMEEKYISQFIDIEMKTAFKMVTDLELRISRENLLKRVSFCSKIFYKPCPSLRG